MEELNNIFEADENAIQKLINDYKHKLHSLLHYCHQVEDLGQDENVDSEYPFLKERKLYKQIIADLNSLRPLLIKSEVDELKIEHSDKCREYFRHLNLMFHAGSGDLKEGHEIAQTMRDEINKLVDQLRSLEAEGKEQAK